MSRTGTQLLNDVKGNLGNRSDGYIGNQAIDTVTVKAINLAQLNISRKYQLPNLLRNATLALTSVAYQYSFPTTDTNANAITVRNILVTYLVKSGETTSTPLIRISVSKQDHAFGYISSSSSTGTPRYYTYYNNKLEFFPYPDGAYTAYFRLCVWHTDFDDNNMGTAQALGTEFDDVIENFATMVLYKKLQQIDDAAFWNNEYKLSLREAIKSVRHNPDWKPSVATLEGAGVTQPWLNPTVRR